MSLPEGHLVPTITLGKGGVCLGVGVTADQNPTVELFVGVLEELRELDADIPPDTKVHKLLVMTCPTMDDLGRLRRWLDRCERMMSKIDKAGGSQHAETD